MDKLSNRLSALAEKATKGPLLTHSGMLGHKGDLFSPTAKSVLDCHHFARFFAPKPEKSPACTLGAKAQANDAIAIIEANAALVAELVNNLPTIISALQKEDM